MECCEELILKVEKSSSHAIATMASMLKAQVAGATQQTHYIVTTNEECDVWATTWWEQFIILLVRGLKERRHDYLSKMRITQVVASAILAGCLWWKSQHATPEQLQDQVSISLNIYKWNDPFSACEPNLCQHILPC